ncbi:MAG TPA: selenoneine synthase SenA [Pyrinomonadaceae bacterium]|nr:selenoneine synthase SenA [Pyrinomonadaceae bacterium]
MYTTSELIEKLQEARLRTLRLVDDLDDEQMIGPRLSIVNPLRWEIGHVAWFQEYWVLRHLCGRSPRLARGDALYDSAKVAHDTRWDLKLPRKSETIAYTLRILDDVTKYVTNIISNETEYFLSLALFHEDMHGEAITYTRQTLGYPAPGLTRNETPVADRITSGDAFVPGGSFLMGNSAEDGFVFDNEKQPLQVDVEPFAISRTATTNAEFLAFVDDRGYERRELWSNDGWHWRQSVDARHPVYWNFDGGEWWRRDFDQLVKLESNHPVLHVNWYEADAFCRWARRRLPTEAEWEMAASTEPGSNRKRRFPWGDQPPTPRHANLDSRALGCVAVDAFAAGDSAYGCRQMIGNTWEWTATDFLPYPGFVAGPYKEYSEPWFGNHKVLRGGCWATRSRLINNTYRNFYTPDRRDVWAGFRTCAL